MRRLGRIAILCFSQIFFQQDGIASLPLPTHTFDSIVQLNHANDDICFIKEVDSKKIIAFDLKGNAELLDIQKNYVSLAKFTSPARGTLIRSAFKYKNRFDERFLIAQSDDVVYVWAFDYASLKSFNFSMAFNFPIKKYALEQWVMNKRSYIINRKMGDYFSLKMYFKNQPFLQVSYPRSDCGMFLSLGNYRFYSASAKMKIIYFENCPNRLLQCFNAHDGAHNYDCLSLPIVSYYENPVGTVYYGHDAGRFSVWQKLDQ